MITRASTAGSAYTHVQAKGARMPVWFDEISMTGDMIWTGTADKTDTVQL
jgi:hypothetical protein